MNVKIFVLLLFTIIVSSCKNTTTNNQKPASEKKQHSKENWKVVGTEPFWSIQIDSSVVLFSMLNDKIDSVYFEINDFVFIDNATSFKLVDKNNIAASLHITGGTTCSDGMSDKQYQYSAIFKYKELELKGCAEKK